VFLGGCFGGDLCCGEVTVADAEFVAVSHGAEDVEEVCC